MEMLKTLGEFTLFGAMFGGPVIWLLQCLLIPTAYGVNKRKQIHHRLRVILYLLIPGIGLLTAYRIAALESKA